MADTLTTSWTDLLYELRGPLQAAYPKSYVLLAEFQRDTSRKNFSGNQVRVPIYAAVLQGAQALAEGGNVTQPQIDDTLQAHIPIAHMAMPISVSPELMAQTEDNAAAKAIASKTKRAREALSRGANEMLHGNGDAQLAFIRTTSGGALTFNVSNISGGTAGVPARQVYKGRIVDVRTIANGADPGQGLKRKIASTTKATDGTVASVTFLTGGFGGGSGNIVATLNTDGIFIQDSYGAAAQGLQQIGAVTGTFEAIDKAANEQWQGTDGRGGVTTAVDPDLGVLDFGILTLGERTDLNKVDFFVGDPSVILNYQQQFYSQTRFEAGTGKLETGFSGPLYNGQVMVGDFDHQRYALTGITKESLQMYGYQPGPDWDNLTGAMWQRFGSGTVRTRNVEAWLVDDFQFGAHECRTMVRWQNLNRA